MLVKYLKNSLSSHHSPLSFGSNLNLNYLSAAYFSRRVAPKGNLSEKLGSRKFVKPTSPVAEHDFAERADPESKELDDQWMSLLHLNAQSMPELFLRRAQKVFVRFPQSEVRNMGKSYMKLYQLLHASEKPSDVTQIKPFANTADVIGAQQAKIYLGKKYRWNEKPDSEKEEKEKRKKEKEAAAAAAKKGEEDVDLGKEVPNESDQGIVYDQNTALAYLQRKVPHTFGVAARILTELRYRLPTFKPKTFLDFGAGLGSGSWAFYDVYREFDKIVAVEPAVPMRKLGKFLTEDLEKIAWFDSLARLINMHDMDGLFDVVYCGYVIEEAKNPEARALIIETLWQRVRPGGVMILVEPGSPKGFRFVHDFRQWILEKPRDEASIIAPCPHHKACPQAKPLNVWCNFEQAIAKYPNNVFTKTKAQPTIDHEKFSFMVVRKGGEAKPVEECETPAEKSFHWPRMVRPAIKRHKHIILDVCNTEGEIERRVIAKSHGEEGGYNLAKKVRWGDLWCIEKRIPNKFRKEGKFDKRTW